MTENDDDTPPIRLSSEDVSAGHLLQQPTPREVLLSEQVGLHADEPVPFWMFAKVALRQDEHSRWIGQADGFWRRVRRHARAGLATLAVNLAVIGGFVYHRIAASAAADERALQEERHFNEYRDSIRRELERLEQDIRDLRRDLRRIGGADPHDSISIVQLGPPWPP